MYRYSIFALQLGVNPYSTPPPRDGVQASPLSSVIFLFKSPTAYGISPNR
jgi:hypothetical protein